MPTPQPQRSTYRERRINVMLQESAAPPATPPPAPLPATPEPPASRPTPRQIVTSRRTIVYVSLATAILCAAAIFFLLFRHDTLPVSRSAAVQPVQAPVASPATPVIPQPAQPASQTPSQPEPATKPVERTAFRLSRANRTQTFGELTLKMIATNTKRASCVLLITTADQTPAQHTMQINRYLTAGETNGAKLSIMVTGIGKESVRGFITAR